MLDEITVRTFKYDGTPHRSWTAKLIRREKNLLALDATFPEQISHELLGTIEAGTHSLEYYWLDRWYNVFRFSSADGELRNYYCNVNMPPEFRGSVLDYVDLDLDILVAPDFSYQILDREDFEANALKFDYSSEIRERALEALEALTNLIEQRQFPFDS